MPNETAGARVAAAPQPERVIGMPERWLIFYNLVDTRFFRSILKGGD